MPNSGTFYANGNPDIQKRRQKATKNRPVTAVWGRFNEPTRNEIGYSRRGSKTVSLYPIRAQRPAARQGKNSGRSTCGLYIATCNNLASEAPARRVDCRGPQQVPARCTLPPPSAAKSHRSSSRRRCATNTPEVAVHWYLLRVAEYRDERVCLCIYLSMYASTFPRELHCEFKKKQETAALSETSLSVYW